MPGVLPLLAMRQGLLFETGILNWKTSAPAHFCCNLPAGCFDPALGIDPHLAAAPNRNPSPLGRQEETTAQRAQIPAPSRLDSAGIKAEVSILLDHETKELRLRSLSSASNTHALWIGLSRHVAPGVQRSEAGWQSNWFEPSPKDRMARFRLSPQHRTLLF